MVTQRPHTPDPYPERCCRHPGACQGEALNSPLARTFTDTSSAPRSVVHLGSSASTRMLTTTTDRRHPIPFDAAWTVSARSRIGQPPVTPTPVDTSPSAMNRNAGRRTRTVNGQHLGAHR